MQEKGAALVSGCGLPAVLSRTSCFASLGHSVLTSAMRLLWALKELCMNLRCKESFLCRPSIAKLARSQALGLPFLDVSKKSGTQSYLPLPHCWTQDTELWGLECSETMMGSDGL